MEREIRIKLKDLLINSMIIIATVCLTLLISEITFRYFTGTKTAKNIFGYTTSGRKSFLKPYVMFGENSIEEGGTLNTQGFLGEEFLLEKDPNEFRIAVLGGSAVRLGKPENALTNQLEKYLAELFPNKKVKVANFGRSSYVTAQELITLQREVLALKVDLVIFYHGYNDIAIPYQFEPQGVGYPYFYSNLDQRVKASNSLFNLGYLGNWLSTKSAIFNHFQNKQKELITEQIKERFEIDKALNEYQRNLTQMIILTQVYQVETIVSPQAFLGEKKELGKKELATVNNNQEDMLLMTNYYKQLVDTSEKISKEKGVYFISYANFFEDTPGTVFTDRVHITGKANGQIAKDLAEQIKRLNIISEKIKDL